MDLLARSRAAATTPWSLLFSVSGMGILLSMSTPGINDPSGLCVGAPAVGRLIQLPSILATSLPALFSFSVVVDWALMLIVMMPPLLAMPLLHVWRSSMPRRRPLAIAAFVAAYGAVWLATTPLLSVLTLSIWLIAGDGGAIAVFIVATTWRASPYHQAALNRCHRTQRIGLIGWRAIKDAVAFGGKHAQACVASCWVWMILPPLTGTWHLVAMVPIGLVLLADRLSSPTQPRWRWPLSAQVSIRRALSLTHPSDSRHA